MFLDSAKSSALLLRYPECWHNKPAIKSINKDELAESMSRNHIDNAGQYEMHDAVMQHCENSVMFFRQWKDNDEEILDYKIAQLQLAVYQDIEPEKSKNGVHGAVFYKTQKDKYIGVFKTRIVQKEVMESLTYRCKLSQHCFVPVNDLACEKAAYIVANFMNNFINEANYKLSLAPVRIINLNNKLGAFFVWQKNCVLASKETVFLNQVVHEIAALNLYQLAAWFDMLIGNMDRHPDNAMLSLKDGKLKKFVLIDNANSFPEKYIPLISITARRNIFKCWLNFRIADEPFTEDVRQCIGRLPSDFVIQAFKKIAANQEMQDLNALSDNSAQFPSQSSVLLMQQRFQMIKKVASGEFKSPRHLAENVLNLMTREQTLSQPLEMMPPVKMDLKSKYESYFKVRRSIFERKLKASFQLTTEELSDLLEKLSDIEVSQYYFTFFYSLFEKGKGENTGKILIRLFELGLNKKVIKKLFIKLGVEHTGSFLTFINEANPHFFAKLYPLGFRSIETQISPNYLQKIVDEASLQEKSKTPTLIRFSFNNEQEVFPLDQLVMDAHRDIYLINGRQIDPQDKLTGRAKSDAVIELIYLAAGSVELGEKVQLFLSQGVQSGLIKEVVKKFCFAGPKGSSVGLNVNHRYSLDINRNGFIKIEVTQTIGLKYAKTGKHLGYIEAMATFKMNADDLLAGKMDQSETKYWISAVRKVLKP